MGGTGYRLDRQRRSRAGRSQIESAKAIIHEFMNSAIKHSADRASP